MSASEAAAVAPSPTASSAASSTPVPGAGPGTAAPDPEAHIAVLLEKLAKYVEGEAEISIEDYRLLQAMNLTAAERYSGMAEDSAGLVAFAQKLQSKCETVMPQLAQVCAIAPLTLCRLSCAHFSGVVCAD